MRSSDASLLLVTHAKKGSKMVGLDDLAGGASYQRLAQCILWIERHKTPKTVTILADCGHFVHRNRPNPALIEMPKRARARHGVGLQDRLAHARIPRTGHDREVASPRP